MQKSNQGKDTWNNNLSDSQSENATEGPEQGKIEHEVELVQQKAHLSVPPEVEQQHNTQEMQTLKIYCDMRGNPTNWKHGTRYDKTNHESPWGCQMAALVEVEVE